VATTKSFVGDEGEDKVKAVDIRVVTHLLGLLVMPC
jgi:hypothetical protein